MSNAFGSPQMHWKSKVKRTELPGELNGTT